MELLKPCKIIHIITRLDKGGSADIVLQLCSEFKKKGYDVSLLAGMTKDPTTDLNEFMKKTGVKITQLPYLQRKIHFINDLKSLFFLLLFLKKEKPKIVHLHSSKAGFIGRIAARLAGVKCIIYTTHGHIFYGYFNRIKTSFFIIMERFAAHFCDVITTLTEKEKKDFCNLKITHTKKIIPAPNGLNLALYSNKNKDKLRGELKIEKDIVLLGWIGRFEPIKRPDLFLSLCERLNKTSKTFKAVMIGDGSQYQKIKDLRSSLGLSESVYLTGYRDDIPQIIPDIDILTLTSGNEGFGMVVLEAMAAKIPVVAMDVGGLSEIIKNGITGYLVPDNNLEILTQCILKLIENREKSRRLGKNGYKRAFFYSFNAMFEKYRDIYSSVLKSKKINLFTGDT